MDFSSLANGAIASMLPYRMGKPVELVHEEIGAKNFVRLNSGENPYGISRKVQKVLERYADKLPYYPDAGAWHFKKLLSSTFNYDVNNITAGADNHELISLLARAFLNPSVNVIVPRVNSIMIERAVRISGAGIRSTGINDDWEPVLEEIVEAIDDRTRMIIMANPSNPLGAFVHYSSLEKMLQDVPEDVLVVIDEELIDYLGGGYKDLYDLIINYPNLVLLRSFSHIYGLAGLRIGYMLSCDEICGIINVLRDPYNVSQLALDCACAALTDNVFTRFVLDRTNTERNRYREFCSFYGLAMVDNKTNTVTIDFGSRAHSWYNALMRQGIFTRHLEYLGLPSLINITMGHPDENDFCLRRIEQLILKDSKLEGASDSPLS